MKADNELYRKLTRSRTQLLLNQPFFGTLCLRLKLVAGLVPTMATDGRRILYNPGFAASLTPEELQAVLAHEVMHCALAHHCRRGQRDLRTWNEAADYAINPILVANGFVLPKGALLEPEFAGLSAEEIYAQLLKRSDASCTPVIDDRPVPSVTPDACSTGTISPHCQDSLTQATATGDSSVEIEEERNGLFSPVPAAGFGEVLDASDESGKDASEAEKARQQHEWNIAAEQAMRSANACGHEPINIERPISETRRTKQDWRSVLRDFVAAITPSDYQWTPPKRRHVASGIYLPSLAKAGLGTIVIAVDTSGSIGDEELAQFAGEIEAIADEVSPERIHVVYCDAEVQSFQEFGPSEPIILQPRGGGGTDFRPVFQWVEENQITPVCLIYLTDLCCHSYPDPPDYPVLWITDSRRIAPFGETLQISLD